ncbi:antitoxin VapB family protein [Paraburkholderia sp. CNPSo 3274]|uniref:antitoxin VapB family protein n=1 Tax=Paraburkholderia sp. CNPSo 3274 TaxID=2940932 RepID=UPI0020B713AB|nr:antitoxin VapB family protein [Paraburkholderia sp. CNPSo 3274]MCP3709753.1 antitoxin VapB family protein [Paraburkholderia sp. CNPSo 3274]
MGRPRAEYRNEIKTRVRDEVYERLQEFKQLNFIESDSQAIARLLEMLLCGIVPASRSAVSGNQGNTGPRAHA